MRSFFTVFFFPADVFKLVVYFLHVVGTYKLHKSVLKPVQVCHCSQLFILVLTHVALFPCVYEHLELFCWLLPLKMICGDDPRLGISVLFPFWLR